MGRLDRGRPVISDAFWTGRRWRLVTAHTHTGHLRGLCSAWASRSGLGPRPVSPPPTAGRWAEACQVHDCPPAPAGPCAESGEAQQIHVVVALLLPVGCPSLLVHQDDPISPITTLVGD